MSKTWDFLLVNKPNKLPKTVVVQIEASVDGISYANDDEPCRGEFLNFVIGPTYWGSPIINRKLTFSIEETPQLDYPYTEAGKIKLDNKDVYLLLEEN